METFEELAPLVNEWCMRLLAISRRALEGDRGKGEEIVERVFMSYFLQSKQVEVPEDLIGSLLYKKTRVLLDGERERRGWEPLSEKEWDLHRIYAEYSHLLWLRNLEK